MACAVGPELPTPPGPPPPPPLWAKYDEMGLEPEVGAGPAGETRLCRDAPRLAEPSPPPAEARDDGRDAWPSAGELDSLPPPVASGVLVEPPPVARPALLLTPRFVGTDFRERFRPALLVSTVALLGALPPSRLRFVPRSELPGAAPLAGAADGEEPAAAASPWGKLLRLVSAIACAM